jgi:hypothetical protein
MTYGPPQATSHSPQAEACDHDDIFDLMVEYDADADVVRYHCGSCSTRLGKHEPLLVSYLALRFDTETISSSLPPMTDVHSGIAVEVPGNPALDRERFRHSPPYELLTLMRETTSVLVEQGRLE